LYDRNTCTDIPHGFEGEPGRKGISRSQGSNTACLSVHAPSGAFFSAVEEFSGVYRKFFVSALICEAGGEIEIFSGFLEMIS
jgi:hypothetical protein